MFAAIRTHEKTRASEARDSAGRAIDNERMEGRNFSRCCRSSYERDLGPFGDRLARMRRVCGGSLARALR